MKRFIKISLIISAVLATFGAIFVIIGVSTGGIKTIKNDMLNGNIGFNWTGNIILDAADVKGMSVYDGENISADNVKEVSFNGEYGSFEITFWDNEGYALEDVSKNTKIYYSLKDGVLKITPVGKKNGFWRGTVEGKLYIPRNANLKKLDMNIGAGTIGCSNIEVEQLNVSIGAGDGSFDGIKAKKASFNIGAGSGDIKKTSFEECDFMVGMGDLSMNGTILGDATVDCGMGNIELKLTGRQTDYNYTVTVGAGDVIIGDKEFSGYKNRTEVDYNASKNMTVKCGMGDATIDFE